MKSFLHGRTCQADSRTALERGIYAASASKLLSAAKRHKCRALFGLLNPLWRTWCCLALWAAAAADGQAQFARPSAPVEEPRWLTLRLDRISVGAFAEGTFEDSTFKNSGTSATHDRLFVGPTVGLGAEGSIYHPNFLRYQLDTEGGYGRSWETLESDGKKDTHDTWQWLGQFSGSAEFLPTKPYQASLYANRDHSYSRYDFFNEVIVDSTRYGARLTYNQEPFYVGARYAHRDEEVTLNHPTTTRDDVFGLDARHERTRGTTSLNYTYTLYNLSSAGGPSKGDNHAIALADTERFGSHDQYRLHTSLAYDQRHSEVEDDRQLTAAANFEAEHRANLSSAYDLNYDHFKSGGFSSDNYVGQAQLRHQLFESLTSTVLGRVADFEGADSLTSGYTRRYGAGLTEDYVKRLGTEHRLHISNSLLVEQVEQQQLGTIRNEPHNFTSGSGPVLNSFFLNQPNVMEPSIVVSDVNRMQIFAAGLDYRVTQLGDRTYIERLTLSPIPDAVVVDYKTESTPAGSYQALTEFFQIRFDFFKNLWGVYGRLNLFLNNAPEQLRVQNVKSYTVGSDLSWRWLRAGAEYLIYDSEQSKYESARLFQGATFRLADVSNLSLNFSESWTDYISSHRKEQDYRFISRYHRLLTAHLGWDLEGGIDVRRGAGVEQTQATARTGIEYAIGKLSVRAGYDYQYNEFLNTEVRDRHFFYIRARRVF